MGLEQLLKQKQLDEAQKQIDGLKAVEAGLVEKSKELEISLECAADQAALDKIEKEIEVYTKAHEDAVQTRAALEKTISDLTGELSTMAAAVAPVARNISLPQAAPEAIAPHGLKFFSRDTVGLMARAEVKEFIERFKAAAMSTRGVQSTDILIPDVFIGLLRDNLDKYSKLIGEVNLRRLTGTSRITITAVPPEGVWTEQCANLNELDITFFDMTFDGWKVGDYIPICKATLEDADLNLADEIMYNIGQAIGLALDKAILYGTGDRMPLGIVTRLKQSAKPSAWADTSPPWVNLAASNIFALDLDGLSAEAYFSQIILALGKVKPNYASGGTFWVMNRKTRLNLLSKAVTFNAAGALVSSFGMTMPVEGGKVVELDFLADGDVVGGYGSLYQLIERHGMDLQRSDHVRFLQDQIVFKGTARYDGAPVFGEAFVAFNINDVAPKTAVTFAPDTANEEEEPATP